jgi:hypothetical protein
MKLKYVGNGSFLVGIPARDLSASEVKRFGLERLVATGLYTEIIRKPKAGKPEEDQSEEAINGRN